MIRKSTFFMLIGLMIMCSCSDDDSGVDCNLVNLQVEVDGQSTLTSTCNETTGNMLLVASGTSAQLEFSIDDGLTFQQSSTFNEVGPGNYNIVARDEDGCEASTEVLILSEILFSDKVMPIITTFCAITDSQGFGCHIPGGRANTNFQVFSEIRANANEVKRRVMIRNMPRSNSGLTLTDKQIAYFVCWVDDGAKNN